MNRVADAETEQSIDLLDLLLMFWEKKWLLLAGLVIGALVALFGTKLLITPQYQSTSMIYIYSKTTSVTSIADLQLGSQLTVDFQIVATTREVIDSTIEKLGLDTTYEALVGKIGITNPSNSHILKITVTDADPQMAADISNTVANELRARIADVMNTDEPAMVEKAVAAKDPVSPSLKKNVAIGGLILVLAICCVLTVIYLMDDTIKGEDDVEKYLRQNVLAAFPVDPNLAGSSKVGKILNRRSK